MTFVFILIDIILLFTIVFGTYKYKQKINHKENLKIKSITNKNKEIFHNKDLEKYEPINDEIKPVENDIQYKETQYLNQIITQPSVTYDNIENNTLQNKDFNDINDISNPNNVFIHNFPHQDDLSNILNDKMNNP